MGKTSAIFNLMVPVCLMATGFLVSLFFPFIHASGTAVFLALFFCVTGGAFILVSKVPRFAAGHWVSFGFRGLPVWARFVYLSGYALLVLGSLAGLAIHVAAH